MFLCDTCIHNCKKNLDLCANYEPVVSEEELEDLNYEIKRLNCNIKKFCRDNGLKYKYLLKMLKGKMNMSYKVLYLLNNNLLNEKDWVIKHLEKYPEGLNTGNTFYEDSLL